MTRGKIVEIKHFAVHDGPGIRTTVFVKGCTLRCVWCHNPESVEPQPELAFLSAKCQHCGDCTKVCPCHTMTPEGRHVFDRSKCAACGRCAAACCFDALIFYGKSVTPEELLPDLLADSAFYETTGGGVTVSGGEPLMQSSFTAGLLKLLKEHQIHTAVDTCGNVSWDAFEEVLPYTNLFLYDLKHPESDGHRRCTGSGNERILENLRKLDETGKTIEIRMPIVPGWNDGVREMRLSAEILRKLHHLRGVKLLSYHNFSHAKYDSVGHPNTMPQVEPPPENQMRELASILEAAGIRTFR